MGNPTHPQMTGNQGKTPWRNLMINRTHVRAYSLQYAERTRAQGFKRVSSEFYEAIDAHVRSAIRSKVDRMPSTGITLR